MSGHDSQSVLSIRLGSSLCYFLPTKTGAVLIDAGNAGRVDHLSSVLLAHEHELQRISLIILTHTHHDHVGSLAELKLRTGAKVMVHAAEAEYLIQGHTPLPHGTSPWTHLVVQTGKVIGFGKYEAVQPDLLITEDMDLHDYGIAGRILTTPGHTMGSISVIVGKMAFVGDTLFGINKDTVFPPFVTNAVELLQSWNRLLDTECLTFHPGHGKAIDRWRFEHSFEKLRGHKYRKSQ
jgi:glyoxylase-like metal-dependent hydrolase (beta-lactamase superfamily II)